MSASIREMRMGIRQRSPHEILRDLVSVVGLISCGPLSWRDLPTDKQLDDIERDSQGFRILIAELRVAMQQPPPTAPARAA